MSSKLNQFKLASKFTGQHKVLGFVVCFSVFLIVYILSISPETTGLNLSDLLLMISSQRGLLPSPGYSIYSLLLQATTNTLGKVTGVALSGHILSAFFGSLALSFLYASCLKLYQRFINPDKVIFNKILDAHIFAGIIVVVTGFTKVFWRYSLFTERYTFSALILSLAIFLLLHLVYEKKLRAQILFIFAFTLGLGISHQWIFIPFTIISLFLTKKVLATYGAKNRVLSLAILFCAALLPQLLLVISFHRQVPYAARLNPSLVGIADFVSRQYLGDGFANGNNIDQIIQNSSPEKILNHIWIIIGQVFQNMGWWTIPLVLAAILFNSGSKKSNPVFILFCVLTVLMLSLAFILNWHPHIESLAEVIPNLVMVIPLVGLFLWFGIVEIITRINAALSILVNPRFARFFIVSVVGVAIAYLGISRINQVSLRDKAINEKLATNILGKTSENSLLVCFSYSSCYSLLYHQQIGRLNTSSVIVPFYYLPGLIEFDAKPLQGFDYQQYPFIIYDIISWNRYNKPIYVVDMFEEYFALFGIDFGFMSYVPYGYFSQLTNGVPERLPVADTDISEQLLASDLPSWDKALEKVKFEMIKRHLFNSSIYFKTNNRTEGQKQANMATNLGYNLEPSLSIEIAKLKSSVESIQPNRFYDLGYQMDKVDKVMSEAQKLESLGALNRATKIAQGAVTLDPKNVPARLKWAGLLEKVMASNSAVVEYNNVLTLDPSNQTAKERLSYQENLQ